MVGGDITCTILCANLSGTTPLGASIFSKVSTTGSPVISLGFVMGRFIQSLVFLSSTETNLSAALL